MDIDKHAATQKVLWKQWTSTLQGFDAICSKQLDSESNSTYQAAK